MEASINAVAAKRPFLIAGLQRVQLLQALPVLQVRAVLAADP
jgi:hypothetical protein